MDRPSQADIIFEYLRSGTAYTLWDLEKLTGFYAGSIASRIRDLRCKGFDIRKKLTKITGVFTYQLIKADHTQPKLF